MAGYGQSSKPPGSSTHIEYSKREMANDLVQVMSHFGFEKFNILAHDRGARVAHRLALDHADRVGKVVLLDIAPTLWMYEHTAMAFVSLLQCSSFVISILLRLFCSFIVFAYVSFPYLSALLIGRDGPARRFDLINL